MKKVILKSFIFFMICVLLEPMFGMGVYAKDGDDIHQFHHVSPYAAIAQMGAGWNLGNTLDAIPTEGSRNNPPVQEKAFDQIKADGFKSIRIPVTWESHLGPAPDYKVDPVWMNRVKW